jgi:putative peptidoglycan lipid II flippase
MSRQAALGDEEGLKESLRFALALIALITIPASVGLILCAIPAYSLFFMNGAFSYHDVRETALALAAYAPGLFFLGISRVVVPAFYAMKDTKTPVWISCGTLLVNAGFGLLLMKPLLHVGLALAITLSTVFNASVLLWALRRKIGRLGLRRVFSSLLRILPAAGLMGVTVWSILNFGLWQAAGERFEKAAILALAIVAGGIVYAGMCVLLRVPEAGDAAALLKRKLKRSAS